MVQVSPDTEGPFAYSGYAGPTSSSLGFSHIHLSGPGVRKGGDMPFMPTVGPVLSSKPLLNASPFNHVTEIARAPGDYRVLLERGGIGVELAATTRAGMQRYTFPPGLAGQRADGRVAQQGGASRRRARRWSAIVRCRARSTGRYRVFFVARFSAAVRRDR